MSDLATTEKRTHAHGLDYGDEFLARLDQQLHVRGITRLEGRTGYRVPARKRSTGYDISSVSNILADWNVGQTSADSLIKTSLVLARSRSREMERNNTYVSKYLNMCVSNIIGPVGVMLQNKAKTSNGKNPDVFANDLIEDSWKRWGKKGICSVDGQYSFHGIEKLTARGVPRDGEFLVRKVFGFDNEWSFALQVFEADRLDINLDGETLSNGNTIRMGVEKDKWQRPVAYHILEDHPGDYAFISSSGRRTARIPATEMKLIYLPLRAEQTRGFPWVNSAAIKLHQLGKYEEAEVVAARSGASKMFFYERETGSQGTTEFDDKDADGNPIQELTPGVGEILPPGWSVKELDPTHPGGNFGPFIESQLQGVGSGLDVSYVSLANNLKGVNFSSIRQGVLDERNSWRMQQGFIIEELHNWVYPDWLRMALLTDLAGTLTFSRFGRYNQPSWDPRGWEWVDPKKDAEAAILEINNQLNSRTKVLAKKGLNFESILADLVREKKLIEAAGLSTEEVDKAIADTMQKTAASDTGVLDIEEFKKEVDAYSIGVRAGTITPQTVDEDYFRARLGIPVVSDDVKGAWESDGGVRRPITLQSGKAFDATQEGIEEE